MQRIHKQNNTTPKHNTKKNTKEHNKKNQTHKNKNKNKKHLRAHKEHEARFQFYRNTRVALSKHQSYASTWDVGVNEMSE